MNESGKSCVGKRKSLESESKIWCQNFTSSFKNDGFKVIGFVLFNASYFSTGFSWKNLGILMLP